MNTHPLYMVKADGVVIEQLGRRCFSKGYAEEMAKDLSKRGYDKVEVVPWKAREDGG